MWRLEYAYSIKWADVIVPILVSGIEALVKTDRGHLTHQFASRASALARELGLDEIDYAFAERMYDGRSEWIHGGHFPLMRVVPKTDTETVTIPVAGAMRSGFRDVALLQDLLRGAIRDAIEDGDFRGVFADDDAIRDRWPVPAN